MQLLMLCSTATNTSLYQSTIIYAQVAGGFWTEYSRTWHNISLFKLCLHVKPLIILAETSLTAEYLTRHYLFWKSLVQKKLLQMDWAEPESIYKVQHPRLTAKMLGVGCYVQHGAVSWWNPSKETQHLRIGSVDQLRSNL